MTNELVTVYGTIRPSVDDGRREDIAVTRSTYEDAYNALTARVPEHWILLGVSRWPIASPETVGAEEDNGTDTSERSTP